MCVKILQATQNELEVENFFQQSYWNVKLRHISDTIDFLGIGCVTKIVFFLPYNRYP